MSVRIEQDAAGVPGRSVLAAAAVVLVVTALSIGVVIGFALWLSGSLQFAGVGDRPVPEDVGKVESAIFARETAAERQAREAGARLERWGWVDRERGRVHMPIETAMELLLAGPRPWPDREEER